MQRDAAAVRRRWDAVWDVVRNRDLRRLELAWGGFFLVEWLSLVAVSVWAFGEGGASTVGLVGMLRLVPAAVALPFGASIADRLSRHHVLTIVYVAQAVALTGTALAISADVPVAVFVLVALTGVLAAPCRPAQMALTPLLARSPTELVGANVTAGTLEGVATLVGPLVAGAVLAVEGPELVLTLAAIASATSAITVLGIRLATDPSRAVRQERSGALAAITNGAREILSQPGLSLIVGCFIAQLFVRGVLSVLTVSFAFAYMDDAESGVGWLGAAMGVGGLIGAVAAVRLTGCRRLALPIAVSLVLWGLPITVIGLVGTVPVALLALAVIGVGNTLLDVSGFTMLQRLGDDRMLSSVFGAFYTFGIGAAGVGALLAPTVIDILGLDTALVVTGLLLPVLAVVAWPALRRIDARSAPSEHVPLIAAIPLFAPLTVTTLEKIAARATVEDVGAGSVIIREGDQPAERFYVIADGLVLVSHDETTLAELSTGDYFGEIALLHDVPRTATVTAVIPTRLVSLASDQFMVAVAGNDAAAAAAHDVSSHRQPHVGSRAA